MCHHDMKENKGYRSLAAAHNCGKPNPLWSVHSHRGHWGRLSICIGVGMNIYIYLYIIYGAYEVYESIESLIL